MRMRRFFFGVTLLATVALLAAPASLATSARTIYADYADNGRLDRAYSPAELRAGLKDTGVQGYGHPNVLVTVKAAPKRTEPIGVLGAQAAAPLATAAKERTLPFTGFDLGLLLGGGAALLVIGASLRRLSRESA